MRRSLLFIPGNNPAMLQNSDIFGSDTVIFDLEDAVDISEKDAARTLVSEYSKTLQGGRTLEIAVRVNGFDTGLLAADLKEIVSDSIDTVVLPKARARDLDALDKLLSAEEKAKGMKKKIGVMPIVELAASVLEMNGIAAAPRVNGLLLGAEDLTADLGTARTRRGDEILFPRMQLAYVCAAYGIDAVDTPFTDTKDEEGLAADCAFAKGLGLQAKAAIHPNQIPAINRTFVPAPEAIASALRIEQAAKKAREKGQGAFSLDGKMVDKPIIERARKTLEKAKKYNLL